MEYMTYTGDNKEPIVQFLVSRGITAWIDSEGVMVIARDGDHLPYAVGQRIIVEDGQVRIEDPPVE